LIILYHEFLSKETININADTIDFIGLNIDVATGEFDFKTYYAPADCYSTAPKKEHPIIELTTKREMTRFIWKVRDSRGLRSYAALTNRTDANMNALFNALTERYPHIRNNESIILSMSKMKITDAPNQTYASAYIFGFKDVDSTSEVVNIEWMTRKCPDANDVGYEYEYNDTYFLNFIRSQKIRELDILVDYSCNASSRPQKWVQPLSLAAFERFEMSNCSQPIE